MTDTDKRIKEAWEMITESRPDMLPSEEELRQNLHFTKEFPEQQTKNLPSRYFYVSGRTISKLFVFILIIILLASSITVYAVVQMLKKQINNENTDISLEMDDTAKIEMEGYIPFYIPSGYFEVERNKTDNSVITHYMDGTHNIYFRQELPTSQGSFDTEDTEESSVVINGNEGIYWEKHNEKTLIFTEFGYVFYIDTNSMDITKEHLIRIAESIKKE